MKKESWALVLSGIAIAISIATACFCIFRINRTQGQWRINRDIEFNERIIMFATSR